jgi:hypothetical protein
MLLNPSRSVRLVQQKALNSKNIGVNDVQNEIISNSWKRSTKDTYLAEVQRSINWAVLKQFFHLASSTDSSPQVRAITLSNLRSLQRWLESRSRGKAEQKAMHIQAAKDISDFLNGDTLKSLPKTQPLPPGSPIG